MQGYGPAKWTIDSTNQFVSAEDASFCLDLGNNGDQTNGNNIDIWTCASSNSNATSSNSDATSSNSDATSSNSNATSSNSNATQPVGAAGARGAAAVHAGSDEGGVGIGGGVTGGIVECLNDGSCYQGTNPNPRFAKYSTQGTCQTGCGTKWGCQHVQPDHGVSTKYCIPDTAGAFSSAQECYKGC
jgi:hypothetical protein